ncbi:hypothetical protein FHS18_003601 [Paenibacillus phyllosphaerae]|uniref:Probable pectate lyase C n=1 Tax=Paenibacillus phyllosphaerae TaxID=274593 RepID=A0A7W5AZD7_9BACL|nr:DNRLRE domain-containing protein [Paenibacillus phyllosphaerae]MBB3111533.1 hypothetical protein [Paenibacillus phyllosphaerae]
MNSKYSSEQRVAPAKYASRLLTGLLTAALAFGMVTPAGVYAAEEPEGGAAAPIVLKATDDAHISRLNSGTNYGYTGSLEVTHDGHPSNVRRTYLKFNLDGIDLDDYPSGILRLYNNDTRYNSTVTAYETDGNPSEWTEDTIIWNNAPAPGPAITTLAGGIASVDIVSQGTTAETRLEGARYYEIDVSNHLRNVTDNGSLTIILQSSGFTTFASKTFAGGAYPPQLVLNREATETPAEEQDRQLDDNGRSSLYPEDWYPGFSDEEGRFLHDFSYAGYRMGQSPPEEIPGVFLDVTEAPYSANNTGADDVTAVIQRALDDAGEAGGGVVYLPPGTYRIKPQATSSESLRISHSGVVLRGAGPEHTFLFNDEPVMRSKDIIAVTSENGQFQAIPGTETFIRADLPEPTVMIPVQDASLFEPGDWVTVSNKYTAEFIEEHQMTGWWDIYEGNEGITFYRKVVAIDTDTNTITIDIPTRYPLKIRDFSSVYKLTPPVTEVGVEHLSIGNVENLTPGLLENDYMIEGTGAHQVAGSKAIRFIRVVDAWARNVHSYRPPSNSAGYDYHILSSGITTFDSRNVTIADTDIRKPLSRGGGGNGYLYELIGNDNLIVNARAEEGRHNYSFSHMRTNGNVIRGSVSRNPSLVIDFHQYLSASNLIDGIELDGDRIEASVRPYPSTSESYKHGVTTSQSVFWNTHGVRAHPNLSGIAIDSRQYGNGYIIGTRGNVTEVRVEPTLHSARETAPVDYVEGLGQGELLQPQSLYLDQLDKRNAREALELQSITLNGNPIAGFQPGKRNYKITLPYGTSNVPTLAAVSRSEGATAQVEQAAALPGTAVIRVMSQDGLASAQYTVNLDIAKTPAALQQIALVPDRTKPGWNSGTSMDNGTTAWLQVIGSMSDGNEAVFADGDVTFESDNEGVLRVNGEGQLTAVSPGAANVTVTVELGGITLSKSTNIVSLVVIPPNLVNLPIVTVSSSSDDGNVVENIIDNNLDTRWSASGEGQWAIADLGQVRSVNSVSMAFYNGQMRKTIFELEVSVDGEQWTKVYDKIEGGNSSGTTNGFELFVFDESHNARYVRFIGYGNNLNLWNSISELRIHPGEHDIISTLTGTDNALAGQPFDLTYGLANVNVPVYAQDLTVAYDPEQLVFVQAVSVKDSFGVIAATETTPGTVRIIAASTGAGVEGDSELLKLSFTAKELKEEATATVTVTSSTVANDEGEELVVTGSAAHVAIKPAADTTALVSLIGEATELYDAAVVGTQPGQYPAAAKAALQAAISNASAVADNAGATDEQVSQAVSDLTAAIAAFTSSVITRLPGDTTGDGAFTIGDLGIVAAAYGKTSADADWAKVQDCDIDHDGIIDIADLAAVASSILGGLEV